MNKLIGIHGYKTYFLVGLLGAVASGCDSGHWDASKAESQVAPSIVSAMPSNNSQKVALNYASTVSFSEAMDPATINTTTFTMTGPDNTPVAGTVVYSSGSNSATFTPTANLLPNTNYKVTVNSGAKDLDGLALQESQVWTFTTGLAPDITAPTITQVTPADMALDICSNRSITVQFNEPINSVSLVSPTNKITVRNTMTMAVINGDVTLNDAGTLATFTSTSLAPATSYTAKVGTGTQDLAGNALAQDKEWTFTTAGTTCQNSIALGKTAAYGVLSNTGITLGGGPNSVTGVRVQGNVGIFPGALTNCVGCDTTTVTGLINVGNTAASDAINDLTVVYDDAVSRSQNRCTLIDSGSLVTNPSATCNGGANGVFFPGLYWSASSIMIPANGTITLDAKNDADAVFIFQSESTIDTIGGNTHIILANQAQAKNVFWLAKSAANIGGSTSDFVGTVIAQTAITVNTGTHMTGRALARTSAVTVQDGAVIMVPAN